MPQRLCEMKFASSNKLLPLHRDNEHRLNKFGLERRYSGIPVFSDQFPSNLSHSVNKHTYHRSFSKSLQNASVTNILR